VTASPVSAPELVDFLRAHPPFQTASDAELLELVAQSTLEPYSTGVLIADFSRHVPDDIWMVLTGSVNLQEVGGAGGGQVFDTIEPGGIFGYVPMLTGGGVEFLARAIEATTTLRLRGDLVRAQFAKPAGLRFLASSASPTPHAPAALAADSRSVSELVRGDVLIVDPGVSVRDAVVQMSEQRVSYALIRLRDGGIGIFTDRDLRTRVVAAGLPVDVPITEVMSAPAQTVTADRTAETVLLDMLERGMRHMPVLSPRGEVLGVLEDVDLLAASARQSFVLRRAIAQAPDAAALQSHGREVTQIAVDLFRTGTKASAASSIASIVLDALVRKALELALAEAGPGPTQDQFAWLTLGSIARREAMPSSDVDSALSWADSCDTECAQLRAIAARAHAILDGCGLPADSNGAIASHQAFGRSATDWVHAAEGWLDDPLRGKGLILSSLLIDGRVVWGNRALHTVPTVFRRMRDEHPNALRLQLLDALSGKVRTWSLRDVLARRGGTFDLKTHAVTPIVNLARWGGLTADMTSASTPARLAAAASTGALTERDSRTLTEVFVMLQRIRLAHQVELIADGRTPNDVVTVGDLSPLNRSLLGDGLREIAAVQRRARQSGTHPGLR
jgi:CBS domain-containing protein